ncbi:MAG: hypothetical protein IPK46_00110 [Saprospiraceae bacterium]|nr:hypothetical protein [Saprospiraceae bacterium]
MECTQIRPEDIKDIKEENEASLGWFQIDNIIGSILGLRGKSQNGHLKEMMALEVEQLLYTDSELFSYIGNDGLTREMKEKIYQSPFASATLKSALKNHLALIPNEQRGLVSVPSLARNFKVGEKDDNLMTIQVNNVASSIIQIDPCHQVNAMASYEIILNLDETRGQGNVSINIDTDLEDDAQILVIAQDEQGKDQFFWMAKSEYDMEDIDTHSSFRAKINDNQSATLFLESKRGILSGFKKLVVNIVRALKDQPASALEGLIKASFEFGQVEWKVVENTKDKDAKIEDKDTVLLLIHGTFSSVEASFHDLLHHIPFQKKLTTYKHVLGFNHSTIMSGIATNCTDLTELLRELNVNFDNCTVISTSRGGLIARKVFAKYKAKLILSACPNEGTPMADKKQIVTLANRITKLSYGLAGSSLVPGVIAHCVELMAKGIWSMQGLEDMAPESKFIKSLPPLPTKTHLIGVNHDSDGLKSVVDIMNDNLVFGNELNDMVVPLNSAVVNNSPITVKIEKSTSTHHLNYFKNESILNYILKNI